MSTEISNLKSQIEGLENKIAKASQSTNARFKRKKIQSMKREFGKIIGKTKRIRKISRFDRIQNIYEFNQTTPSKVNKRIENKIDELNKKIGKAKNKRNKELREIN